jgi:hypothetical protein
MVIGAVSDAVSDAPASNSAAERCPTTMGDPHDVLNGVCQNCQLKVATADYCPMTMGADHKFVAGECECGEEGKVAQQVVVPVPGAMVMEEVKHEHLDVPSSTHYNLADYDESKVTKIQSLQRGNATRKQKKEGNIGYKQAADEMKEEAQSGGSMQIDYNLSDYDEASVIKIQALQRGNKARGEKDTSKAKVSALMSGMDPTAPEVVVASTWSEAVAPAEDADAAVAEGTPAVALEGVAQATSEAAALKVEVEAVSETAEVVVVAGEAPDATLEAAVVATEVAVAEVAAAEAALDAAEAAAATPEVAVIASAAVVAAPEVAAENAAVAAAPDATLKEAVAATEVAAAEVAAAEAAVVAAEAAAATPEVAVEDAAVAPAAIDAAATVEVATA